MKIILIEIIYIPMIESRLVQVQIDILHINLHLTLFKHSRHILKLIIINIK